MDMFNNKQKCFSAIVNDKQECLISIDSLLNIIPFLQKKYPRFAAIIDKKVFKIWGTVLEPILYNENFELICIVQSSEGESGKHVEEYLRVIEILQQSSLNRRDALIIIGGGACCDMGGFVASTFMRGIPYILIPTTLMAMVDAAHGGKVAVNLSIGKNLLGGFHTPEAVWIDTDFLNTLPEKEFKQALGEVIKIAVISDDSDFFKYVESISKNGNSLLNDKKSLEYLITYSIKKKLSFIEKDWKEKNLDRLLNAGHEVAHALEKIFDFNHLIISHGEAVAIGLSACTRFSKAKGFINHSDSVRIINLIQRFGLKTGVKLSPSDYQKAVEAMNVIKRVRDNNLRAVLPETICKSFIYKDEDAINILNYIDNEYGAK